MAVPKIKTFKILSIAMHSTYRYFISQAKLTRPD